MGIHLRLAGLDDLTTAMLMVDLSFNSSCLSSRWLCWLACLKDYLFPFSFHLHLKFPDMPKGMWFSVRSVEEHYSDKLFKRLERECHNKLSAPKYFRLWECVRILITSLCSPAHLCPANKWHLLQDKWELYGISSFNLKTMNIKLQRLSA